MNRKSKIDWVNHLIELIVVIIGITIAFMLNNWREDFKNHQLERKYLNSFLDDLRSDASDLDTTIQFNEKKLQRLQRFLKEQIRSNRLDPDSAEQILFEMLTNYLPVFKQNTYESVKNSGNFNLISDYSLKEAIVSYYTRLKELHVLEEFFNNYLNNYVLNFAFQNADLFQRKILSPRVVKDHRFRNLVTGYFAFLKQVLDRHQEIVQYNRELQKKIGAHLSK